MKVTFHATVRDAAGVSDAEIDATDIGDLLLALKKRFGERFYSLLVSGGRLREDVVILLNGQNITHSGGMKTRLSPADEVSIFPPVSGG